jgi:hypothetical protein
MDTIATRGTRVSMGDGAAIQVFSAELASELVAIGDPVGAAFIAPMALLQTAVRASGLTVGARLQAIQVAYSMFREQFDTLPGSGVPHRGAVGAVVSFNTPDRLRRAMNLCVVIYWVVQMQCAADLSRIGTHPLELRFGMLRCLLRGVTQWNYFVGAEAYSELVKRYTSELGIMPPAPAKRVKVAGAVLRPEGDTPGPIALAGPEKALGEYTRDERGRSAYLASLRAAARVFMSPDPVARRRSLPIFWPYLIGIAAFLEEHPDATEDPSPDNFFSGLQSEGRFKAMGSG